jgi:glycerol-3-phosphate acyltransferase PlsY
VTTALSLVVAYLLGSIPFAYFLGRRSGVDIRAVGDHNVGAFNVFRHVGLTAGIGTVVADSGKGALAMVVAKAISGDMMVVFLAGGIVVAAHNWPAFLHFRGGRGAATAVGVLLVLLPREMSISLGLATISLWLTRNSICFSAMLFILTPLLCWLFGEPLPLLAYSAGLPCIVGLTHWVRVHRLSLEAGREAKTFWVLRRTRHNY